MRCCSLRTVLSIWPDPDLTTLKFNRIRQFIRSRYSQVQPAELASGSSVHCKYNYSATQNNGQIVSQQDVVSGETTSYQYDSLKRMVQASGQAIRAAVGRRLSVTMDSGIWGRLRRVMRLR